MAIRTIVKDGDPILRRVCRPVDEFGPRLKELVVDMVETMRAAVGVGLAAPQVGVMRRVAVVEVNDQVYVLVNPEITDTEGSVCDMEGCLSFPGQYGMVTRPAKVTVKAQNAKGKPVEYTGEGLLARAFCHEIDHLNGKVFVEVADRMLTAEELDSMRGE